MFGKDGFLPAKKDILIGILEERNGGEFDIE
jgi:hypothetical protein